MKRLFLILCLVALAGCAAQLPVPWRSAHSSEQTKAPRQSGAIDKSGPILSRGEHWIEVDLANQVVRLHIGEPVTSEYPVATGRGDSPSTLTYTGTFTVYSKIQPRTYLPDMDVYVANWVGFDPEHAIGFHSLPMDRYGKVVDSRLGVPISHGCVRVGNAAAVYNFAVIGMRVVVH